MGDERLSHHKLKVRSAITAPSSLPSSFYLSLPISFTSVSNICISHIISLHISSYPFILSSCPSHPLFSSVFPSLPLPFCHYLLSSYCFLFRLSYSLQSLLLYLVLPFHIAMSISNIISPNTLHMFLNCLYKNVPVFN